MKNRQENSGTIYLCATPIGNLEDITLRVLRVLKEVDCIAAEDTRHTLKLLNHYGITKPLISLHQHNEHERSLELIERAKTGQCIAVVSDAGMPLISDPGLPLVRLAREEGVALTVLPGASAGLTALALSGMDTRRFCFEGFLPEKSRHREERIKAIESETRTTVLYESPHALQKTLKELANSLGSRRIVAARELTKKFEETLDDTAENLFQYYQSRQPKGEYVLIIEGNTMDTSDRYSQLSIQAHLQGYIENGLSKKEAIKQVARDRSIPKAEVYKESIEL